MIKDGNYYYLDFEKYRSKFEDVLTRYYGEKNRDRIIHRLNKAIYVPFTKYDSVIEYY